MGKMNDSLFSSNKQTWETPQELFDKLNNVFNFEVDIAAADDTAKCKKYYTKEDDGLVKDWVETCWCNPPYGREQIKWVERASEEVMKYNNTIVMLIPARPDTKVWHNIIFKYAKAICFIKGRLKFGNSKDSAPFPSAIIVFSNYINDEQIKVLNGLGKVFVNKED